MLEFDPVATPTEVTIVWYFEEGLKPSIKAEIDQDDSQLIDYKELVSKAVRANAKAGLQSSSYMRETDLNYLRGSWPAYTTTYKVETQGAVNCGDKSWAKNPVSAPMSTSTQDSEPSNKARKDKKKKQHEDKKNSKKPRDSSTLATKVNKTEISSKRKKDISEITYYNCNKKGHYATKCPELQKSKN